MQVFEEGVVRDLWCEMLGIDAFDDASSFVELGGTSIIAEQLAARISDSIGVDISGLDVLHEECYAKFIDRLAAQMRAA